jgi:hypothetical protein
VKRELRALQDVVLVDSEPDQTISIVEIQLKTKSGQDLNAFNFSTVFGTHLHPDQLSAILLPISSGSDSNATQQFLQEFQQWGKLRKQLASEAFLRDYVMIEGQHLYVGEDNLRNACEEIVADFDTECLDPRRKLWRQNHDEVERLRQQLQEQKEQLQRLAKPVAK